MKRGHFRPHRLHDLPNRCKIVLLHINDCLLKQDIEFLLGDQTSRQQQRLDLMEQELLVMKKVGPSLRVSTIIKDRCGKVQILIASLLQQTKQPRKHSKSAPIG